MSKVIFINAFEFNYIGTRLLASYLRKSGHTTHNILLGHIAINLIHTHDIKEDSVGYTMLFDGELISHMANRWPLLDDDMKELEKLIAIEQPDIIGFSARSVNNYLIPQIVPALRKGAPSALLAAGGYGPTLEPHLYLEGGFDVVVRGDGEEAMLELADCWDRQDLAAMRHISNTCWSKEHGGSCNPMRDQEKHLEKYPPLLYGHEAFSVIADGAVRRHFDPLCTSSEYLTYLGMRTYQSDVAISMPAQ